LRLFESIILMFTGLIQDIGRVNRLVLHGGEATLSVATAFGGFSLGESIAINGACLSVTAFSEPQFSVFASRETLDRTGIGHLRPGDPVNLERALKVGEPLGGHLVSGHVDARIRLVSRNRVGAAEQFALSLPDDPALAAQVAPKGSVALDGVSLTVNEVHVDTFNVMIIPLTLSQTTLGQMSPGASIHLETDILAKYVSRALGVAAGQTAQSYSVTMDLLMRSGFVR